MRLNTHASQDPEISFFRIPSTEVKTCFQRKICKQAMLAVMPVLVRM